MKNLKKFKEYVTDSVNEKDYSQFNSKEQRDIRQAEADWSNAVLSQDVKGMKKHIKELVKTNDAYIKWIENKK